MFRFTSDWNVFLGDGDEPYREGAIKDKLGKSELSLFASELSSSPRRS